MTPHDLSALLARIGARRVVASISGGKDSAAMSLYLHELGIEHDRVFMDTGWEHEATYEYLRGELTQKLGPITEIRGPETMEELIRRKGTFPSRQRRFCTEELKVKPFIAHVASLRALGAECVNNVGIRGTESESRSKLFEWDYEPEFGCEVWRPLISWSEQDVIDMHHKHGLRPNPLYLMGASRVGCWPCINARKEEIRLIADTDHARIARIRALEADVAKAAEARYERDRAEWLRNPDPEPEPGTKKHEAWAKKRKRLESPFRAPAYFQAKMEADDGTFPAWPIDEVVSWSKTQRGGRKFELFAAPRDHGCMRWGMCEQDAPDVSP
jgi:3'-phosphoadenosine 5'-phosphosulfate sulfotransferase (PAPS reductase)/FAD synthetase